MSSDSLEIKEFMTKDNLEAAKISLLPIVVFGAGQVKCHNRRVLRVMALIYSPVYYYKTTVKPLLNGHPRGNGL